MPNPPRVHFPAGLQPRRRATSAANTTSWKATYMAKTAKEMIRVSEFGEKPNRITTRAGMTTAAAVATGGVWSRALERARKLLPARKRARGEGENIPRA